MVAGDPSSSGPGAIKDQERDGQNAHFRTTGGRSLLHDVVDAIPTPSLSPRTEPSTSSSAARPPVARQSPAMSAFVLRPPPAPKRHPPPHRFTYPLSQTVAEPPMSGTSPMTAPPRQTELQRLSPQPPTPRSEVNPLAYSAITPTEVHGRWRLPPVSPTHLPTSNPDGPFGLRSTTDGAWSREGPLPRPAGRFAGPFGEAARGPSIISGTSKYHQSSASFSTRRDGSLSPGQSTLPDGPREAGTMGRSREIDDERRKLLTRTDPPRTSAANLVPAVPVDMHPRDRRDQPIDRIPAIQVDGPKASSRVSAFFNPPIDHHRHEVRSAPARRVPFASPPPTGPSDAAERYGRTTPIATAPTPDVIPRVPSPVRRDVHQAWFALAEPSRRDTRQWPLEHIKAYDAGFDDAIRAVERGLIGVGSRRYENPMFVGREGTDGGFDRARDSLVDGWHDAAGPARNSRASYDRGSLHPYPPRMEYRSTVSAPVLPSHAPSPYGFDHSRPASYPARMYDDYYNQHARYFPHLSQAGHGLGPSRNTRQLISCYPCRGRKLECDGKKPCEQCTRRGSEAQCSYASHVRRRGKGKKPDSEGSSEPESAREGRGAEREASSSSGGGPHSGSGEVPVRVRRSSQEPSIAEEMDEEVESARIKTEPDGDADGPPSARYQLTSSPVVQVRGAA